MTPVGGRRALLVLTAWLVGAFAFTALGGLRLAPPPLPQAVLAALVVTLVLAAVVSCSVRRWLATVPAEAVLVLHLSRFVGFYFLVLHGRGRLPHRFAVLGGWGDVAVATLALALLLAPPRYRAARSPWLLGWNAVGLVDILFVVGTAARSALADPESMAPLTELPLGLLPTWLVPLIIVSHGVLIARTLAARRADDGVPGRSS